jgi:large subunit ribosomal protein L21
MSKSKSKIVSPKAWYLVAAGGVALTADGVRRLLRRRQQQSAALASHDQPSEYIPVTDQRASEPAQTATTSSKPATGKKAPAGSKPTTDNLTAIKGIGPVFAKRLNEAGIATYAALAAASADQLREVTHATAASSPEEWIAQAKALGK